MCCRFASILWLGALLVGAACTVHREPPDLVGQDVRVTVIHTSDIHSRLLPYYAVPNRFDQGYGLLPQDAPFGGIARMGYIIKEQRSHAGRSIWLDSGDCFQGAPIFNLFFGEAEFRALSSLGIDGAVLGNHEFDLGSNNLYEQIINWSSFPVLAANYYFSDPSEPGAPKLKEVVQPYQVYDVDGVIVAAIGMANHSSMLGISEGTNSLGIRPLDNTEVVKSYVALLRPVADVVVLVSHMGLNEDEGLAPSDVIDENEALPAEGVDLILGGHLHIVLNPPRVIYRDAQNHPTLLVHSGAFAKFVGRLDLVVHVGDDNRDPARRSFIKAYAYDTLPVSCGPRASRAEPCPFPSDPDTLALLQPYTLELYRRLDLDGVFAFVNTPSGQKITRNDVTGGDSQLGNLVARAMQQRQGVNSDFALTNSLGIRADFEYGALTLEQMYNVFPFENTITVMTLSGSEVKELLDYVARRSSERGCRTQAQVAGIAFEMHCGANPRAEQIYLGDNCRLPSGAIDTTLCSPLNLNGLYRVAVNNYIAAGGSGFDMLKRNTSKIETGIGLRGALMDYVRSLAACGEGVLDSDNMPVTVKYGPITCLDETIEAHDERILPLLD